MKCFLTLYVCSLCLDSAVLISKVSVTMKNSTKPTGVQICEKIS